MERGVFNAILATYLLMLLATGTLAFYWFPNLATVPEKDVVSMLRSDPELKADLLEDLKVSRQRTSQLIQLASHSFDVLLGALLGFLSAVAAHQGIRKKETPERTSLANQPPEGKSEG
jgi:hypothetical protein